MFTIPFVLFCFDRVFVVLCPGSKITNVSVVYTMHKNLKKTGAMATGQVGFHNDKEVCWNFVFVVFACDEDLLFIRRR